MKMYLFVVFLLLSNAVWSYADSPNREDNRHPGYGDDLSRRVDDLEYRVRRLEDYGNSQVRVIESSCNCAGTGKTYNRTEDYRTRTYTCYGVQLMTIRSDGNIAKEWLDSSCHSYESCQSALDTISVCKKDSWRR